MLKNTKCHSAGIIFQFKMNRAGVEKDSLAGIALLARQAFGMTTWPGRFCRLFVMSMFISATGCGPYSFSGSASTHIKTIAVPVFEDRTAEFGVKDRLSTAIVDEFTRDNTLKIADRRMADSVLLGTLMSVQETAGAYNQQESVQEVRVTVTVQLKYEDLKKRKTLWEAQMSQFGSYSPRAASSTRQAAIDEAIRKIANEVRNKTVSDW
jgi:hypothetical protein